MNFKFKIKMGILMYVIVILTVLFQGCMPMPINNNEKKGNFSDYETRKRYVDAIENSFRNDWNIALVDARRYTTHKSEELRRDVYALLWKLGKDSTEQQKRQNIVEVLLERVPLENDFLREQLLKWLQDFKEGDFNDRSKTILQNTRWPKDDSSSLIRLTGIAQLKSRLPELKELVRNENAEASTDTWYGKDEWAGLLALARMGDVQSLHIVINRVKKESDIVVRATILLKDMAYTKQPAAFDTLKIYLNSEDRLPSTKETVSGSLEACYAAALFSKYLENFPIKETDFNENQVHQARAWVNAQKQWQFK